MALIDRFLVWVIAKRAHKLGRHMAEQAPEKTMRLGMTLIEAVMTTNPDAGVAAIARGGENWGVMQTNLGASQNEQVH